MAVMPAGCGPTCFELEDVIGISGSCGDRDQVVFDPAIDDPYDTRAFQEFESVSFDLLADEAGEDGSSVAVSRTREDLQRSSDRGPDGIPSVRLFKIDPGIGQPLDIEREDGAATIGAGQSHFPRTAQGLPVTRSGVADIAMSYRKIVHVRSQKRSGIPTKPVTAAMEANQGSLAGPRWHVDSTLGSNPPEMPLSFAMSPNTASQMKGVSPRPASNQWSG